MWCFDGYHTFPQHRHSTRAWLNPFSPPHHRFVFGFCSVPEDFGHVIVRWKIGLSKQKCIGIIYRSSELLLYFDNLLTKNSTKKIFWNSGTLASPEFFSNKDEIPWSWNIRQMEDFCHGSERWNRGDGRFWSQAVTFTWQGLSLRGDICAVNLLMAQIRMPDSNFW
jgi:hypothetical protein